MQTPVCTSVAVTCTLLWGGEYRVALSRSSAAAWMTGSTAVPLTLTLAIEERSMRRYSRIRDMAPRSTLYSATGSGHWRPGRPPPSTEMESASLLDQRGAVVDAEQVVEDLGVASVVLLHLPQFVGLLVDDGLDAAGDVHEGALRGVAHDLLGVDDGEHRLEQPDLRLGQVRPRRVELTESANHLSGRTSTAQPVQRGGRDLLGEPDQVLVVVGDALLQMSRVTHVLKSLLAQFTTAPDGFGRHRDHQQRGDGTAPADRGPGGLLHQRDTGPGHRGHDYGGEQQHARIRQFTASWGD